MDDLLDWHEMSVVRAENDKRLRDFLRNREGAG